MHKRITAVLLATATVAYTADPVVQDLFNQAREKVLDNGRRIPRYTCVETIDRAQYLLAAASFTCDTKRAHGNLVERDRLRLDVAVVDGGEIFSWAGAGKFESREIGEIVGGGASGSGEFGGFLLGVFGREPDNISFAGRRDSLAVFSYRVPVGKSSYQYRVKGPAVTMAYRGTFSVDPDDGDLQQLVVEPTGFAAADPVCSLQHVMDYQRVKMGSAQFVLPEVSTMSALYRNGAATVNRTHFSDCREYVGESTIRFDDVEEATGGPAAKAAVRPLPPKLKLSIGLTTPIKTELAATGDALEGVLLRDAGDKKTGVLAKAGDRVHGRIIRLQQFLAPVPRWFLEIRFDSIERGGVAQAVSLRPLSGKEGVFEFPDRGNFVLDQKFHSDWETR